MRSQKWIILAAVLLLLTIGAELVFRPWESPKGCVQVINERSTTMEDLVVTYGDTKLRVGSLVAGQSTNVWLTAGAKGTLSLDFVQQGNPMNGFQVEEFDPTENRSNHLKLVLVLKEDRVERFMEDDLSTTPWQRLSDSIISWFQPEAAP
jgi:hypothetical protein